jgi:CHAT domain-containing protein
LLDPDEGGIALAGDWVPATQLARRNLKSRLAVVSACQTAVLADIARAPDEAFSLSTAFLAAGSAGAVATLWSIDDVPTALLMTRFYEELFDGKGPAQALRQAQLWLRDLHEAEEAAFLAAHPALENEFQRRAKQGRRPGLRSTSNMDTAELEPRPYSDPEFWAAFVLAGQ